MSSDTAAEVGQPSAATDASGRPLSSSPDAVRKRKARQEASARTSSVAGDRGGGGQPSTRGNPLRPSSWAGIGEAISPAEAESQLYWLHVGLGKAMRSDLDMATMKDEFAVAGENYAWVANKLWPPLRVMIRFVAPIVLVAVLLVIWGSMLAHTPWMRRVGEWWERRGDQQSTQPPSSDASDQVVVEMPQQPAATESNGATPEQAPQVPRRPPLPGVRMRRF